MRLTASKSMLVPVVKGSVERVVVVTADCWHGRGVCLKEDMPLFCHLRLGVVIYKKRLASIE